MDPKFCGELKTAAAEEEIDGAMMEEIEYQIKLLEDERRKIVGDLEKKEKVQPVSILGSGQSGAKMSSVAISRKETKLAEIEKEIIDLGCKLFEMENNIGKKLDTVVKKFHIQN